MRTARLLLRPWAASDAGALLPLLAANLHRLQPWIPARVHAVVPLEELAERLAGFADDYANERAFRHAVLSGDGARLLGQADLFPRAAGGRVALAAADHVEVGYWLDAAATGQGFATEAAGALVAHAATLAGMTHVEIRCAAANAASAGVPRRLGFELAHGEGGTQVWRKPLVPGAG